MQEEFLYKMSTDLQWLMIRNNSSFLLKSNGLNMTKEPNNLRSKNCFRYNGLVHKKTVGVTAKKDGKGVTLTLKQAKNSRRPAKMYTNIDLTRGSRRALATISKTLMKNKYRKDLKMAALRRASALLRSQKPVEKKSKK